MNTVVMTRIGKATYDPASAESALERAKYDAEGYLNEDYWWHVEQQRRRQAVERERMEKIKAEARRAAEAEAAAKAAAAAAARAAAEAAAAPLTAEQKLKRFL